MTKKEMPMYQCHKKVWALQVKAITLQFKRVDNDVGCLPDGAIISPVESDYVPFYISQDWMSKHDVQVGGYIVTYDSGYVSYSPKHKFERGYALIQSPESEGEKKYVNHGISAACIGHD